MEKFELDFGKSKIEQLIDNKIENLRELYKEEKEDDDDDDDDEDS